MCRPTGAARERCPSDARGCHKQPLCESITRRYYKPQPTIFH